MDNNVIEKKKGKGLTVFLIILVLLLGVVAVLSFLGIFNINTFNKKTTDTTISDKKTDSKKASKKNDNTSVNVSEDKPTYLINVDKYVKEDGGTYDLGTLTIDGKKYNVKYEDIHDINTNTFASNLYFNDTKIEVGYVHYIAVMDGKYVVINTSGTAMGGIVTLYDSNFNKVEEIGDSKSFTRNTNDNKNTRGTFEEIDQVISSNEMIVYKCLPGSEGDEYNQTLKQKMITFKDGKYTEKELLTVENVYCKQLK